MVWSSTVGTQMLERTRTNGACRRFGSATSRCNAFLHLSGATPAAYWSISRAKVSHTPDLPTRALSLSLSYIITRVAPHCVNTLRILLSLSLIFSLSLSLSLLYLSLSLSLSLSLCSLSRARVLRFRLCNSHRSEMPIWRRGRDDGERHGQVRQLDAVLVASKCRDRRKHPLGAHIRRVLTRRGSLAQRSGLDHEQSSVHLLW